MSPEELQSRFADLFVRTEALVEYGREVLRQQFDVGPSGPEGRHLHWDRVKAVKQVLAEKPLSDHGGHIAIGGGQNPDIHSNFPGTAYVPERRGVENA